VGRDSSVGIAARSEDRIPVETRFSAPVQTGPGAYPASYTMGPRSFPGVKTAGAWSWPPTPSNAEVKERVELYLYSHSGPSWPVLRWPLPLFYLYSRSNACILSVCKISNDHLQCFFTSNQQTVKFRLAAITFYTELYFQKIVYFPWICYKKLFHDPEIGCVKVTSV